MKKNQKYTAEEMNLAIELWKESGLSQKKYCAHHHIAFSTFRYWQKKYLKEKRTPNTKPSRQFLTIDVPAVVDMAMPIPGEEYITIIYPNGVQVNCPVNINHEQLRSLIKL